MANERQGGVSHIVEEPICGMEVDPSETEHAFEYEGSIYYFCSEDCLNQFRKEQELAWD